jgi:hypothetical protein
MPVGFRDKVATGVGLALLVTMLVGMLSYCTMVQSVSLDQLVERVRQDLQPDTDGRDLAWEIVPLLPIREGPVLNLLFRVPYNLHPPPPYRI